MKICIFCCLFTCISFAFGSTDEKVYHIKLHLDPETKHCIIISEENLKKFRGFPDNSSQSLHITYQNAIEPITDSNLFISDQSKIIEIFGRHKNTVFEYLKTICHDEEYVPLMTRKEMTKFGPEIVKMVDSGDQGNRIDVVFMGDGYSADERGKFFDDMKRLIVDMFEGPTFKSYLPLFNIWAIYIESTDSGIGYDGPKDTPFKLYRDKGQLRGVFTKNPQFARQVCQLTGNSGCDYPSLIGNDDFYGGLGGEFVISTKSTRTGSIVLRHEMGHNFVRVGEEYDNGFVYSGVNSANSLVNVGWHQWLTSPANFREEKSIYRILDYPWVDLSEGRKTYIFFSDGSYSRWYSIASVSAAGEEDSLEFILDGQILPWKTTGFEDREFYDWEGNEGLSFGVHNFTIRTKTEPKHPKIDRMLCSVSFHEFGSEKEYIDDNSHVSAYPTWNFLRRKTYRPTNAGCIMRNMTHPTFCSVCKEGMWLEFFKRISVVDDVVVLRNLTENNLTPVQVKTLKLGQLREDSERIDGEKLKIRWFFEDIEQKHFRDLFEIKAAEGNWMVSVKFITPEVRSDPRSLLGDNHNFRV